MVMNDESQVHQQTTNLPNIIQEKVLTLYDRGDGQTNQDQRETRRSMAPVPRFVKLCIGYP